MPSLRSSMRWKWRRLLVAVAVVLGCGPRRPEWLIPPVLDPQAITEAVMASADADSNGRLDSGELAALPGLADAIPLLDTDGDGQLAVAEIRAWLDRVEAEAVPVVELPLQITRQGRPLAGCTVKLVPEACMGGTIEPAEGVTDDTGLVFLNIQTRPTGGVRCGLYRLEITGKGPGGQALPPRYNTESELGLAVGGGLPVERTTTFTLD